MWDLGDLLCVIAFIGFTSFLIWLGENANVIVDLLRALSQ